MKEPYIPVISTRGKTMKKLLCILALIPTFAFAALPPLYQSVNEFQAILESKELSVYFPAGESIQDIRRMSEELFVVQSEQRKVYVEIHYTPKQKVGPLQFQLVFRPETGSRPGSRMPGSSSTTP